MVAFNPEVPGAPAPNFTGYMWAGRTIPTPETDVSGKTRGEALGTAVKGLADAADTFMKQSIDAKINAGTDQNTNEFIKGLTTVKEQMGLGTTSEHEQAQRLGYSDNSSTTAVADESTPPAKVASVAPAQPANAGTPSSPAGDSPQLLTPGGTATQDPPPAALDKGIDQVKTLQTAQVQNSGKVSNMYFTGQMLSLQQQLRSQYPGYREYIDGKLGNKANEYARELMEQINQAQGDKAKAAEHLHNTAITAAVKQLESGDPSAKGWFGVLQGHPDGSQDASIMEQIRSSNEITWRYSRAIKEAEGRKALGEIESDKFKTPTVNFINETIRQKWAELSGHYGLMDDETVRNAMLDASKSGNTAPLLQIAAQRQLALGNLKSYLETQLNQPYKDEAGHQLFADGRGPTKTYSKEQLDNWMKESMAPYESINKLITGKDVPMASYTEELNKAYKNDAINKLANDDVWGNIARKGMIMHDLGIPPDVQADFYRKSVWGPQAKGAMDYFVGMNLMNQMTGQKKPGGGYVTPSDWADKATGFGSATSRNMAVVLNTVPQMSESKMDPRARANFYHGWFDPGNNILDDKYLQRDFKDDKGNWNPGKVYAFNKIMNPTTLADVKKLNDTSEPGLWQTAGDWAVTNFRDKLFRSEIGDLKDIDSTPWLKVNYNTETHQFGITDLQGNQVARQYKPLMQQSIARLNGGIKAMDNFAKVDGNFDVNAFLTYTLAKTGEGVSQKLIDAIKTGGTKQIKGENDTGTKLGFNEEDSKPAKANPLSNASLQGFKDFLNTGGGEAGAKLGLEQVAKRGVHTENINPTFRTGMEKAITDYAQETGRKPEISSLFRNREEQARAYLNYLHGGGLAAPPGHSLHEVGMAADLNTDAKFANWLKSGNKASKYGMEFLPGHAGRVDPYHIQLARSIREAQ